uniref:glutathione transferase n=1 Tax=Hemiselmis andersenii TaxID=464988 RepID=A0A6U2H7W0_HEMAN
MAATMVKMPTSKVTIAYAPVRGLGAAIKMCCEFAGADYEVFEYQGVENKLEVDAWREGWWADKPAMYEKNSMINIPFVVDGETVVSQSNACLTYLGRKYKLLGSNDAELTKVEQCLCELMDLRNTVVGICYGPPDTYEQRAKDHFDNYVQVSFGKFEKWLTVNKTKFLGADVPTVADFHMFEMLDQHETWCKPLGKPQPLDKFPLLKELHTNIRTHPNLAKYFDGPQYKLTINAKRANFF